MDWAEFELWSQKFATWGREYRETLRDRPVRAPLDPGAIMAQLPSNPPETPESMDAIFADFEKIILPGMTHWQHPRFFAYFTSNAAPQSVLAEQLAAVMAAQCMLWQTSPAATELETRMIDWLGQAIGLPSHFSGTLQDGASGATLAAVLMMREKATQGQANARGLAGGPQLRLYCSNGVHTSIDRAAWFSGIGGDNLVRIPVTGDMGAMDVDVLRETIHADRAAGHIPAGIIISVGGTGTGATDDVAACIALAKSETIMTHVDAAWAGSAMICPEFRHYWAGIEGADSIVFNPHKWLGAQFECAAHFVANPRDLQDAMAIHPAYLATQNADEIINYSEWSIGLGRRFRALKLWFLLRSEGVDALRTMIRNHVAWSEKVCEALRVTPGITIVTEPMLSLFTFALDAGDAATQSLLDRINDDGRIYITPTKVDGCTVIRFVTGQWEMAEEDADLAIKVILELM